MKKTKGRLTLPSESNFLEETKELMDLWGADAIRDSDGTALDEDIKDLDAKIYSVYFVAREHNEFIKEHLEEVQNLYLMSDRVTATTDELEITLMKGYYDQQLQVHKHHDPKIYWQVINRTTGEVVTDWEVSDDFEKVFVKSTPFHEYTVGFLADVIWDPTSMYNHLTNDWGDREHQIPFDVRKPKSQQFMYDTLKTWLENNPKTDVVRFTTFFYHFTLFFNEFAKEKFVDWFGYSQSVSVELIEDFYKDTGLRLTPEDIIDQGYHNTTFRVPSDIYLKFVDYQHRFVSLQAKKLVDLVHEYGKEAVMFLGDNWMGIEPYGPYFKDIGLDGVAGSVGGGMTLRVIGDIPHLKFTEGRFLPYFFPDVFHEGNDPVIEANENWLGARRAIMRFPIDRIGYGGYPSLAYKFPKFVDYVAHVANEFRDIYDKVKDNKPVSHLKVAILNHWGKLRSWQAHMVAHAIYYKQIYSYLGIYECLSGMAVDVEWISFDDILTHGIDESIDVILNAGDAMTAFSGGEVWKNPDLTAKIREFVYKGGGFVGIGQPSFYEYQGRSFQLADVLGVDQELGFSLSSDKYFDQVTENHFITKDIVDYDFGESMKNIYSVDSKTEILEYSNEEIHLSSHDYGAGRGVYIAGMPYSPQNSRLLLRALLYAGHKESVEEETFTSNPLTELNGYETNPMWALVNNTNEPQETVLTLFGKSETINLKPSEIRWFGVKDDE
ncbi:MAG: 1,3-beta-galactosyl-N-acetylhexosamine phosphorylase [Erysipelothrix sp.]|nr:1,3-beta-galactosyl-N-acetylhexosamine phosphorylase [Erysipelothrix sp.]